MEKLEPSCIADVAAAVENGLSVPQKVKHGNTIEPSNTSPRYIPKRTESRDFKINIYTPMLTAALFTIAKRWKQPK